MFLKSMLVATTVLSSFTSGLFANPVEGKWEVPCQQLIDGDGTFPKAVRTTVEFTKVDENGTGDYLNSSTFYKDADCQTKADTDIISSKSQYSIGEPNEEGIYPIDYTYLIEGAEDTFSRYDIVKRVEGDDDSDKLVFGGSEATEEADRPTKLNQDEFLVELED